MDPAYDLVRHSTQGDSVSASEAVEAAELPATLRRFMPAS